MMDKYSELDPINHLVGTQTPTVLGTDDSAVYFNELLGLNWILRRVVLKYAKTYGSLEHLLNDRELIPENTKNFTVPELQRFLAVDSGRGFGIEYKDHGIIAYAGRSVTDKPIAKVKNGNNWLYYANPRISDLIKRTGTYESQD
jgi:hypothetical protein